MARKSIDFSQSLLKFQGKAPADSRSESVPPEQTKEDDTLQKDNHEGSKEPEKESKTKYILQNKSLARSNSVMLRKITDMESRISGLVQENMKLKKTRTSYDSDVKRKLEEKVDLIETNLFGKFAEILQVLKDVRVSEGLSNNPQLDILDDINRPTTSTPIDSEMNIANPFGALSESDPIRVDLSGFRRRSLSRSLSLEPISMDLDLGRSRVSTPQSLETFPEVKTNAPNDDIDQTFIEAGTSDNIVKNDKFSTIIEDKEPTESSRSMEVLKEDVKVPVPKKAEFEWIGKRKEPIKVLSDPKESSPSQEVVSGSSLSPSPLDQKSATVEVKEEPIETTRARRNRKQVDYTPVPLRAKMRRESVKLMDAVGENVLINYAVNSKPADANKRRQEDEPAKPVKRKPLSVRKDTNNNIVSMKEKTDDNNRKATDNDKENELSVFDFEVEGTKRKSMYIGKKTARRNRRQTMI